MTDAVAEEPVAAEAEGGAGAPPSIRVEGFGWTYARRDRPALEGLSFLLPPGHVLLVLGPSGSGKSTLARAIAGLVPHVLPGEWRGSVRIGETEVADTPARFLGERVGLVFQDPDSQLVMSRVEDEVAFGLENRGWATPRMHERVPRVLEQVGLRGFEERATHSLSGGEKQRLAIADVLAAGPRVLVFDEPTANLDPIGTRSTMGQLAELARGRRHTIVLIEHRLEAALPLADEVLLIDERGRQLAFAPASEVGRDAVDLLERGGAWIPPAWLGGSGARVRNEVPEPPSRPSSTGPSPTAAATSPSALLTAEDLRVEYPGDTTGPRLALDGFSLRLRAGERVALVGPNGSGKSTLLLALAGLLKPRSGQVRLGPASSGDMVDPARLGSAALAERIGLVFQDPELGFIARTVREEVALSAAPRPGGPGAPGTPAAPRLPDADSVLSHFGLSHLAGQDPFRLSQGEQRRLSLAALALRPPGVLLLDEPTFGLDRRGTEAVLSLLDDHRAEGQGQILATHDPRLLPFCDRVVALEAGRKVFDGTPAEFLAAPPYDPPGPWRGEFS